MRSILLLIMLLSAACDERALECKNYPGEDKNIPEAVKIITDSSLKNYKLIDRKECDSETYWLAIPPKYDAHNSLPPDMAQLVVINKETKQVTILQGQ